MSSESAIEVSNLTKHYGKLVAVDHIDFNVGKGEVFGLAYSECEIYPLLCCEFFGAFLDWGSDCP